LTGNTSYDYAVRGNNASGDGAFSATSTVLTLPDVPGTATFSSIAATSAVASWSAPAGGAASYKLVYCTGSTCVQSTGLTVTSTSTNPSLTGNTSYDFAVRGTNSSGDGLSAATTTQLTLPDVPSTPTFTTITQTTVTVNWNAPTGGAYAYKLDRCTDAACSSPVQVASTTSTTFGDSGLSANTTYYYRVYANNATGNGLYSPIASVTTSAAASTVQRMVRLIGNVRLRGHVRLL
jgi:hypothetical protein